MWPLPQPTYTALDAYRLCVSAVGDHALRNRFESVEATIAADSDAFSAAAAATQLHTIPQQGSVDRIITRDEMVELYDQRMARKGRPGRKIYDAILSAPPYARCPLCGLRTVSALDHHLPKSRYPSLAVAPLNLVPSCLACNKAKLDTAPTCCKDEAIHPYFDNVEAEAWLHADVVEEAPPALIFSVTVPPAWDDTLSARVGRQFSELGLATAYASHAAEEIVNIRQILQTLHSSGGADSVRVHLGATADSHAAARNNSWQIATYRALASCDWYCDGGFSTV